jgi:hypothetical protein
MFYRKSSSLLEPISICFSSLSIMDCCALRMPGLVVALAYFLADSLLIKAWYFVYIRVNSVLLFLSKMLAFEYSVFKILI